MDMNFKDGHEFAKFLDNNDNLGHFKKRFYLKKNTIYMCGNSLGLASKDAEERILEVLEKWKYEGVKIWNVDNNKYYMYSACLAKTMAELVGADPDEITVNSSTTVNIHQAVSTFYKPTNDKYKILVDDINFPTDRYAVDSQVRLKEYDPKDAVKVIPCKDTFMDENDIIQAMTPDVALILLPAVYYRSAQILDMKKVSAEAKKRDIIIGWDLCHAIGSIEVDLNSLDVDFAVWCTYKYLNGGPGATSGLYINRKHFHLLPGLAGWFGNKKETQFKLLQEFDHRKDASGWQIGTPHLLSMAGLEGSLNIFLEAGISNIRKKSLRITSYLMFLVDIKLIKFGFSIGNPREDEKRGGHVCLEHVEGYRISLALKDRGVVPDFRDPNVLRLTPAPLYTSYEEVYDMVQILLDIIVNETYKQISDKRNLVV